MRLVPIALLFPWLLFEPLFHPMRIEKAVIGMLAAVLSLALLPLAGEASRLRPVLSLIGVTLALSNFFFPDTFVVMASHVAAGALLMFCGVNTRPEITYTRDSQPVTSSAQALREQPQTAHA
jgi:hypothetical protein